MPSTRRETEQDLCPPLSPSSPAKYRKFSTCAPKPLFRNLLFCARHGDFISFTALPLGIADSLGVSSECLSCRNRRLLSSWPMNGHKKRTWGVIPQVLFSPPLSEFYAKNRPFCTVSAIAFDKEEHSLCSPLPFLMTKQESSGSVPSSVVI